MARERGDQPLELGEEAERRPLVQARQRLRVRACGRGRPRAAPRPRPRAILWIEAKACDRRRSGPADQLGDAPRVEVGGRRPPARASARKSSLDPVRRPVGVEVARSGPRTRRSPGAGVLDESEVQPAQVAGRRGHALARRAARRSARSTARPRRARARTRSRASGRAALPPRRCAASAPATTLRRRPALTRPQLLVEPRVPLGGLAATSAGRPPTRGPAPELQAMGRIVGEPREHADEVVDVVGPEDLARHALVGPSRAAPACRTPRPPSPRPSPRRASSA